MLRPTSSRPAGPTPAVAELRRPTSRRPPTTGRSSSRWPTSARSSSGGIWHDDYVIRPVLVLGMLAVDGARPRRGVHRRSRSLLGRRRGQVDARRSLPFSRTSPASGSASSWSRSRSSSASASSSATRRTRSRSCCSRCCVFSGIGSMCTETRRAIRTAARRCWHRSSCCSAIVAVPRIRRAAHHRGNRRRNDARAHRAPPSRILAPLAFMHGHAVLDRHAASRPARRRHRPRSSGASTAPRRCARRCSAS